MGWVRPGQASRSGRIRLGNGFPDGYTGFGYTHSDICFVLKKRLKEFGISCHQCLKHSKQRVTHSIPDCSGLVLWCFDGVILHIGNWKRVPLDGQVFYREAYMNESVDQSNNDSNDSNVKKPLKRNRWKHEEVKKFIKFRGEFNSRFQVVKGLTALWKKYPSTFQMKGLAEAQASVNPYGYHLFKNMRKVRMNLKPIEAGKTIKTWKMSYPLLMQCKRNDPRTKHQPFLAFMGHWPFPSHHVIEDNVTELILVMHGHKFKDGEFIVKVSALSAYTVLENQLLSVSLLICLGKHDCVERIPSDDNPIRTLGDYSKPNHEGYKKTVELPVENNVVPLQSDTSRRTIDQSNGGKLRDLNAKESCALFEDLSLYDNESWNDPMDFPKPVKAITLPQDVPSTSDHHLIELENQVQCLMEAHLAPTQATQVNKVTTLYEICSGPHDTQYCMESPEQAFVGYASSRTDEVGEKRLSHLRTQLEQQQDDMIGKNNLLWKTVFEKLNDAFTPENAGNSMAPKSIATISHAEKEELRKQGIKSPSKLFSPKYLSLTSIKELNKNLLALKRVYFVNSIIILSIDSDTEEENVSSTNAHEHKLGNIVRRNKEETEEEVEEVFDDETKEEDDYTKHYNSLPTIKELVYHEFLLKNPRPSCVKAKIRAKNPSNGKIYCMIGHILIKHAYIDIESSINIMSRKQYNRIMTYKLGPRKKLSNPNKINNFVARVRGLRVFIGSLAYKCDFMILEDTTSFIDGCLGEFVFGKPFIDETGLIYNKEEGTIAFGMDNEKITFKMPHTLEIFKQSKLKGLNNDSIPLGAYEDNFGQGRTHYYQSLPIGDEYMHNEGDKKGIRHLMKLEKDMMEDKGQVITWRRRHGLYVTASRFTRDSVTTTPVTSFIELRSEQSHVSNSSLRMYTYGLCPFSGALRSNVNLSGVASCDEYACYQLLSVSMLTCLGKHDCVERIPSGNSLYTTLPLIWLIHWYVYSTKRTKTKQRRTKPSTRMERVQEIEAEGEFICMQTRSSSKFVSESSTNPISTNSKHRNRRRSKPRVEPFSIPIVTMADNRTMEEMLQAPTEGYGDAIVVSDILAENFEIRTGLL
nr:RNA-metabolising metallo-beta-lactamase family protein [Tanacetum cinerariifolium]